MPKSVEVSGHVDEDILGKIGSKPKGTIGWGQEGIEPIKEPAPIITEVAFWRKLQKGGQTNRSWK